MFPSDVFGQYMQFEYDFNKTFGIMCREEGLRITNDLARIRIPSERHIDYSKIMKLSNSEVK